MQLFMVCQWGVSDYLDIESLGNARRTSRAMCALLSNALRARARWRAPFLDDLHPSIERLYLHEDQRCSALARFSALNTLEICCSNVDVTALPASLHKLRISGHLPHEIFLPPSLRELDLWSPRLNLDKVVNLCDLSALTSLGIGSCRQLLVASSIPSSLVRLTLTIHEDADVGSWCLPPTLRVMDVDAWVFSTPVCVPPNLEELRLTAGGPRSVTIAELPQTLRKLELFCTLNGNVALSAALESLALRGVRGVTLPLPHTLRELQFCGCEGILSADVVYANMERVFVNALPFCTYVDVALARCFPNMRALRLATSSDRVLSFLSHAPMPALQELHIDSWCSGAHDVFNYSLCPNLRLLKTCCVNATIGPRIERLEFICRRRRNLSLNLSAKRHLVHLHVAAACDTFMIEPSHLPCGLQTLACSFTNTPGRVTLLFTDGLNTLTVDAARGALSSKTLRRERVDARERGYHTLQWISFRET